MAEPLEGRELLTGGGSFTTFGGPYSFASSVAAGTDGNLYVANSGYDYHGSITKLATDGTPLATYALPTRDGAFGIAAGSDGGIWVAGQTKLDRLAPDGTVAEYGVRPGDNLQGWSLVAGPDGSAWFVDSGQTNLSFASGTAVDTVITPPAIGRIAADGTITYYPVTDGSPNLLTAGPDGSVDFVLFKPDGSKAIGQVAADGTLSETALPAGLNNILSITTGPDGNLWFLNDDYFGFDESDQTQAPVIGRLTPSGVLTTFPLTTQPLGTLVAGSPPSGLISAPDGNLYFLDNGAIDQVTTDGVVSQSSVPLGYNRSGDTIGPDGNLWISISDMSNAPVAVARYSLGGSSGSAQTPPPASPPSTPVTLPPDGYDTVAPPRSLPINFPIVVVEPIEILDPIVVFDPVGTLTGVFTTTGVISTPSSPVEVSAPTVGTASTPSASSAPTEAPAAPVDVARTPTASPSPSQAPAPAPLPAPSTPADVLIPLEIAGTVPGAAPEAIGMDGSSGIGQPLGRPMGLTRVIDRARSGS